MRKVLRELMNGLEEEFVLCFWKQWKKINTKHDNLVAWRGKLKRGNGQTQGKATGELPELI